VANPPHTHCTSTISVPMYGTAESKSVITVAPQNDIYPHSNACPINMSAGYRLT
jgi:hypothetical protein